MPPKSARAGAENWGKNWGKIPETRHKNGAANQQNCGKPVEKSAKLCFLIAASLSAPFGTKRSQVQILSPRPFFRAMCKRCTDFFVHSASKTLLFHRAISELGENWGEFGRKESVPHGCGTQAVYRKRCAAILFYPPILPPAGRDQASLARPALHLHRGGAARGRICAA